MIKTFYKEKIVQLVSYCSRLDNHKTAFAITSAICIGITPFFGFTFLIATCFGLLFRLNQFILQSVHLLVSPLQLILFYPFMQTGRYFFGIDSKVTIPAKELPTYIYNHTSDFLNEYFRVFMAGVAVWIVVSLLGGYVIYRFIYIYFSALRLRKG